MSATPWSGKYRRISLGIIALVSVFGFEGIAIGSIMPVAVRDLQALSDYSSVFTSFTMASLVGMTLAGLWADRIGFDRAVLATIVLLAIGSVLAGTAHALPQLLLGRVFQGLGLGTDLVTMYVLVARAYPEPLRPKALGMLAGAWVVPGLLGPGLAGLLVQYFSWRVTFLIIPVLLLGPLLLLVPEIRKLPRVEPKHHDDPVTQMAAVMLAIVALVSTQIFLSHAGQWSLTILVPLVVACIGAVALSTKWLMPAGFLRLARGLPSVIAVRGLIAGSFFGAEVFVPLALQHERHVTVALSGAVLSAATVFWFAGSSAQASKRVRLSQVRIMQLGASLVVISIVVLPATVFVINDKFAAALTSALVWGVAAFGMGMIYPTLGVLMLNMSSEQDHPRLSTSMQMSDSFGVVVMTSISGGVLTYATHMSGLSGKTFTIMWIFAAAIGIFALLATARVIKK